MRRDTALKSSSKRSFIVYKLTFLAGFRLVSHSPEFFQQPARQTHHRIRVAPPDNFHRFVNKSPAAPSVG